MVASGVSGSVLVLHPGGAQSVIGVDSWSLCSVPLLTKRWYLGRCFVVSKFKNTRYNTGTADTCGGKKTPQRAHWIDATRKEIYKLERRTRCCWKVTRRPKDRKIIKSKLVFKIKRDYLGRVKKFKVRLVAKGFSQEQGIDYKETLSPVAKGVSFRHSLALVLSFILQLRQLDVETAFPYADLEEDVYMSPPAGIDISMG